MPPTPDRRCYEAAAELIRDGWWSVDPARGVIVSARRRPGRVIGRPNARGYVQVSVRLDGRERLISAHRVIYEHVHGPIPDEHEVNHKNGDPSDNRESNLEVVTHTENVRHAGRTLDRLRRGASHPKAKLTDADVRAIRSALAGGESSRSVAQRFGVAPSGVVRIGNRQMWAHVA